MPQSNTASASASSFRYAEFDAETLRRLRASFENAAPFPHLVLDDFIAAPRDEILAAFPGDDWDGWHKFKDAYQAEKRYCQDLAIIPPVLAAMIQELNSAPFLRFLEQVTGIERLLPDPYLEGAGLHCSGPGGVLAPHTDFHIYPRLQLFRRINILVYLNPAWDESFGGCLELYRKGGGQPSRTVVPAWGACVLFRTDDQSVHGFAKPIAPGRWRRSIALYYYTSTEAAEFSGDETTHWQTHGKLPAAGRARLALYRVALKASRAFSRIDHQLNPNVSARPRPKVAALLGAAVGALLGLAAGLVFAARSGTLVSSIIPAGIALGLPVFALALAGAAAGFLAAKSSASKPNA